MKRIFTLIAVAIAAVAMPAEAQKIKRANEAISRANELIIESRFEEVNTIVDSLLAIDPNYSDALYLRSCLLMEDDNYADALDYCNLAIEYHTRKSFYDSKSTYFTRGNLKALLGKYNDAITDFSQALELTPKKDNTHRTKVLFNR